MKRVLSALIVVLAVQVSWGSALGLPAGRTTTTTNTNFPGIIDNKPLRFHVFGADVLPVEPTTSPNAIRGLSGSGAASVSLTAAVARLYYASNGAPRHNRATGLYATVGGGYANIAGGDYATVGGGFYNHASARSATVGGGWHNHASDWYATVGGGGYNHASDWYATVGGGGSNHASGWSATVGGGGYNHASGWYATVPGGSGNSATGHYSFAAGKNAKANHLGAFVWADGSGGAIASTGINQFIVRASGGIWLGTHSAPAIPSGRFINTSTGGYLSTDGDWVNSSDRVRKGNFVPVDGRDILARLATVPISTWDYRAEDSSIRHIGPVGQDFYAAFGLGADDRHISTIDADGVALAAIQGLYELVREKDAQIADLKARVEALEALVSSSTQEQ